MRLTAHNGRAGKNGTFSAKHNDRNFDMSNASHIDQAREEQNLYWHRYHNEGQMTFEQAEALFYERHFAEALQERNEKSIAQRHPERVRSMDDYRHSVKSCPEEQIMQVGKAGETISAKELWDLCAKQVIWEQERFPQFQVIDLALHVDEEGAPHMHKRGVWIAHDETGKEIVGQNKALKEMGVSAPDPDKAPSRYNNAKMTYTQECREHFMELCLERGYSMETEPKEASKSGLDLEMFKTQQEQDKQALLTQQNAQIEQELLLAKEKTEKEKQALREAQDEREAVEKETANMMTEKEFSRELLSSKQIDKIEVKQPLLDKDKVIISRDDFDKLTKAAAASKNLMKEIKPARETNAEKERILGDAQDKADSIIKDAHDKANTIEGRLAQIQLDEVKQDFPQLFKNDVYQGKDFRREAERLHEIQMDEIDAIEL